MSRKPPKRKRPKVQSVRTTQTGDPDINKIYFRFLTSDSLDGYDFQGEVLSNIKNIRLTVADGNQEGNGNLQGIHTLTLNNVNYAVVGNTSGTDVEPQFYCSIQPTPNHSVNVFFKSADDKNLNISITYLIEDNGSPLEVVDTFLNKPYIFPTEHN